MPTTPNRGYPYPANTDAPSGATQIGALASAVDTDMAARRLEILSRPRGVLTLTQLTSDSTGSGGSAVVVMTATTSVTSGRMYKVEAIASMRQDGGTGLRGALALYNSSGTVVRTGGTVDLSVANSPYQTYNAYFFTAATTGSVTFTARVIRVAGTGVGVYVTGGSGGDQVAYLAIIEARGD